MDVDELFRIEHACATSSRLHGVGAVALHAVQRREVGRPAAPACQLARRRRRATARVGTSPSARSCDRGVRLGDQPLSPRTPPGRATNGSFSSASACAGTLVTSRRPVGIFGFGWLNVGQELRRLHDRHLACRSTAGRRRRAGRRTAASAGPPRRAAGRSAGRRAAGRAGRTPPASRRGSPRPPAGAAGSGAAGGCCGSRPCGGFADVVPHWRNVSLSTSTRTSCFADQPVRRDEPAGEVVEQLRVRRRLAELAEVVGRGDEAGAEQPVPDAVDEHARGERVVGDWRRLGQLEPAAAGWSRTARRCRRATRDSRAATASPRSSYVAADVRRGSRSRRRGRPCR